MIRQDIAKFVFETKNTLIMDEVKTHVGSWLGQAGVDPENISWTTELALIAAAFLITYLFTKAFRLIVIPAVQRITARTKATWDDYLFNRDLLGSVCRLVPPILWYVLLPFAFSGMPVLLAILQKVCLIYLIITTLRLVSTFLRTLYDISNEHEKLRNRPLKGIYQMVNLLAIIIGVILMVSVLIDKDATTILAGLGASAAVLMLIFKDSILGLVAGIQLSANDMLRPGDWITMSKYGADGTVIEVSLTTVKVQNFDKTITTLPPYLLVSDSYQNWRGMWESGGRRIKRSLYIDQQTVRFCTPEEKQDYLRKGWIGEDEAAPDAGTVNLQVFRRYLLSYLSHRSDIRNDLTQLVRQLQPTPEGLPLEIYCFTGTTEWAEYESIQDDVFSHLMAVVPQFGLRLFQRPSGRSATSA